MLDYKLFDVFTILEQMLGKDTMYITDAVKSGKLAGIELTFDVEKDGNGVPTKVQHHVALDWNK